MKEKYIELISETAKAVEDIDLLDLVYKLLIFEIAEGER